MSRPGLFARLLALFSRNHRLGEYDAEVSAHLDLLADDLERQGMSQDAARREARRRFGGLDQARERFRDASGFPSLDELAGDVRYSLRMIRRQPGFASIVVLLVAIGVGANTAIFSLVNAILLQPLAYPAADRLVVVRNIIPAMARTYPSVPAAAGEFLLWQSRVTAFDSIAAVKADTQTLTGTGDASRVEVVRVTSALLPMLGAQPILGRVFRTDEDREGHEAVAMLADPEAATAPRAATDPFSAGRSRLTASPAPSSACCPWTFVSAPGPARRPRRPAGSPRHPAACGLRRRRAREPGRGLRLGRRRTAPPRRDAGAGRRPGQRGDAGDCAPGRGQARARRAGHSAPRADCAAVAPRHPAARLVRRRRPRSPRRESREPAAVARVVARARVSRAALGAGRIRVARQLVVENLLLAGAGGVAGLGLASAAVRVLAVSAPDSLARLDEVRLDGVVLLFGVEGSLASGSSSPRSTPGGRGASPQATLRASWRGVSTGRSALRTQNLLVTAEVALSTVLLAASALLVASFARLLTVDTVSRRHASSSPTSPRH